MGNTQKSVVRNIHVEEIYNEALTLIETFMRESHCE